MLRQSALVFTGMMVMNGCGFIFHAIASRRLGVDEYGALYALISLSSLATLPTAVFSPVIVRFAAEFRVLHDDGHMRGFAASLARSFGIVGAGYVLGGVIFAIPLSHYLHVPFWSVPLAAIFAATGLLSGAGRSFVQGTQNFLAYAASTMTEGVMKVVGVAVFTLVGWRLIGGVLGFAVGSACGLLVVAVALARQYRHSASRIIAYDWRRIAATSGASAATVIATALIGTVDVVLVKHYFDPAHAGIYAAASLAGKIPLYFVGFIPTVLLPQAAHRHASGERTRGVLFSSLATFAVLAAAILLAFHFFGIVVLHALVGAKFDAADALLVPYSGAMVLLAITGALATYGIATHRLAFSVPIVVTTLGTLAAIVRFHPTLAAVVNVLLIGNAITAAVATIVIAVQGRRDDWDRRRRA